MLNISFVFFSEECNKYEQEREKLANGWNPWQNVRHEGMVSPTPELSSTLYSGDELEVIMGDEGRICDYRDKVLICTSEPAASTPNIYSEMLSAFKSSLQN